MLPEACLRAYRNNAVLTASPGQLVLMLYDGAIRSLDVAADAFARPEEDLRRIEAINNSLLKAQAILLELRGTLDLEAGGIGRNLSISCTIIITGAWIRLTSGRPAAGPQRLSGC
jgi:flagellar biosynthetic protein FliS